MASYNKHLEFLFDDIAKDAELIKAAELLKEASWKYFKCRDDVLTYPQKGDKIFEERGPRHFYYNAACTTGCESYEYGYLDAARILTQFIAIEKNYKDTWVYPIAYLYRHHIELSLKNLIIEGRRLCSSKVLTIKEEKALNSSHDLNELWGIFKDIFNEIWPNSDDTDNDFDLSCFYTRQDLINGVEDYIKQLSDIDKKSYSFRYLYQKDGVTRNIKQKYINIAGFVTSIERLVNFFDSCRNGIDYLAEFSE